ncbi:nahA [Symbiodinium sp. KB8]|nr:nahA [Symbiodinium sp. KB8]
MYHMQGISTHRVLAETWRSRTWEEDVHAVDRRERHRQSVTATAWASLSLVTGAVLLWASMAGSKSEAIYLMDEVVRFDTAGPFGEDLPGASHMLTTLLGHALDCSWASRIGAGVPRL